MGSEPVTISGPNVAEVVGVFFGRSFVDAQPLSQNEIQLYTPGGLPGNVEVKLDFVGEGDVVVPGGFTYVESEPDPSEQPGSPPRSSSRRSPRRAPAPRRSGCSPLRSSWAVRRRSSWCRAVVPDLTCISPTSPGFASPFLLPTAPSVTQTRESAPNGLG